MMGGLQFPCTLKSGNLSAFRADRRVNSIEGSVSRDPEANMIVDARNLESPERKLRLEVRRDV